MAAAQLVRTQHNHRAELAKRAKEEKARAAVAKIAADEALQQERAAAAEALAKLKDEHLDELRGAQKDFDARLRTARDELALPIKQAQQKQEAAERQIGDHSLKPRDAPFRRRRKPAKISSERRRSTAPSSLRCAAMRTSASQMRWQTPKPKSLRRCDWLTKSCRRRCRGQNRGDEKWRKRMTSD